MLIVPTAGVGEVTVYGQQYGRSSRYDFVVTILIGLLIGAMLTLGFQNRRKLRQMFRRKAEVRDAEIQTMRWNQTQWHIFTVPELRGFCVERHLDTSGLKLELVWRLCDYEQRPSSTCIG